MEFFKKKTSNRFRQFKNKVLKPKNNDFHKIIKNKKLINIPINKDYNIIDKYNNYQNNYNDIYNKFYLHLLFDQYLHEETGSDTRLTLKTFLYKMSIYKNEYI
jgi:hypothetical protein